MKHSSTDRLQRLKAIVAAMPEKPGSYQYYDADGVIIYVGKAKNLKRRVSSYFHREVDRFKTKVLVSKIHNITYTVVNTEEDALLLENALIKKYNPRYNVLLKDGKTYPSICITGEAYPRIFKTRTINKRYGTYYGPYSHVNTMYTLLELIKKLYHPRTCRLPLTPESIAAGKYKPCLEYHIKNCAGACIGKQSWEEYQQMIAQAREILKGNTRVLSDHLYSEMQRAAEELRFEEAEEIKKQYLLIEQFCAKSEVVSHTITNVDVFTISPLQDIPASDNADSDATEAGKDPETAGSNMASTAFINYMHVTNGTINQSFTFEYKQKIDETLEEMLLSAIIEIRDRYQSTAKEIIVPFPIDWQLDNASFFVPQRGDKHHLLELSMMNCRQYRIDRLKQSEKLNPEQRYTRLMKALQQKIGLSKLPYTIELFDNSNISGTDAVAGCVVYKGMRPSKKDYRKYTIKTVEGPDDYASMQEVVRRRYSHLIETQLAGGEKSESDGAKLTADGAKSTADGASATAVNPTVPAPPDLIICDGGIGQMHCVAEVVWGELNLHIPIAGLAKNERHRTRELLSLSEPVDTSPKAISEAPYAAVQLSPDDELFKVLTQMQDDVHRYAITFHRDKRSKHALHSELDDIRGIGPKAKEAILKHFKSVKKLAEKAISEDGKTEIISVLGNSKGNLIIEYFLKKQAETNTKQE